MSSTQQHISTLLGLIIKTLLLNLAHKKPEHIKIFSFYSFVHFESEAFYLTIKLVMALKMKPKVSEKRTGFFVINETNARDGDALL